MYNTLSNLTELKDRYGEGYGNVGKCIKWLKSLKGRVQPQPKKDWNKNDELNRQDTIRLLTDAKERYLQTDASIPKCIKWLENLSLQNTWKPSEEQMKALEEATNKQWDVDGDVLWHLYQDLKKLREE